MIAELMSFKKLMIKPNGNINGGYVSYNADDSTGLITYQGELDASMGLSHAFPFSGSTKVAPGTLASANLKVGDTFTLPNLTIKITSINSEKAAASVIYASDMVNASGTAILSLAEKAISIMSLNATGTVKVWFMSVDVVIEAVGA